MDYRDAFAAHAFFIQFFANRLRVGDDLMRQSVRRFLQLDLGGSAHPACFAARRDANFYSGEKAGSHSKDVRVEIVSVQQIDFRSPQITNKLPKLHQGVWSIETLQRVAGYVAQIQLLDLRAQYTLGLQRCEKDLVLSAFVKPSNLVQRLALGAAFVEAVDEMENLWFQSFIGGGLM